MTAAEEIRAQREAILAGRWVKTHPTTAQACLVERAMDDGKWIGLSLTAMTYVREAIWALHPETYLVRRSPWVMATHWNDTLCPDEHTALTVLEYAEKLAERDDEQ